MFHILIALGLILIGWGGYVLVTGDFVATLDIAAGLVAWGVGVIALSAIVRVLNKISDQIAERPAPAVSAHIPQERPAVAPAAQAPVSRPPPEPPAPSLVREGTIEGRHYRFFSDGSIEAEGPRGMARYRSIDEAREHILRDRTDIAERPEAGKGKPSPRMPAGYSDAERSNGEHTADPYAPPRGNPPKADVPEDDEWSEPFRMLLRGDSEQSGSLPKSGKR